MRTRSKGKGLQASRKDTSPTQGEPYKSPQYKLVRFFDKSRRQWKAKCRAAKATIKVLKTRIGFLEESKERWKRRARALEEEVARLTAPGRAASREGQALKKNSG
jgi:hypothetical protein